jgi:hypothetical protein
MPLIMFKSPKQAIISYLFLLICSMFLSHTQAQPTETMISCCNNAKHASGFYASDLIPRTQFTLSYNKDGARLESSNATIFLGVSCDAYSPQFGYGSWGWANGGTKINFVKSQGSIGFPQQVPSFQDSILRKCALN